MINFFKFKIKRIYKLIIYKGLLKKKFQILILNITKQKLTKKILNLYLYNKILIVNIKY